MEAEFPRWADAQLSAQLESIRSTGEGSSIEFKERFPDQSHRIAQELAAFGTSGGGTLFIGINDGGELVGAAAATGDARDELVHRARGIVSTVRPSLHAEIIFCVENGIVVLAIQIPKQEEPVFYYDHRPYIRDGRESRPATPEEVKRRVWEHPSAEFARKAEEIKLQQIQNIVDMGRRS